MRIFNTDTEANEYLGNFKYSFKYETQFDVVEHKYYVKVDIVEKLLSIVGKKIIATVGTSEIGECKVSAVSPNQLYVKLSADLITDKNFGWVNIRAVNILDVLEVE